MRGGARGRAESMRERARRYTFIFCVAKERAVFVVAHASPTLGVHAILCCVVQGKPAMTDSRRARQEVKQVKQGSPTLGSHVMCTVCSFAKRLLASCLRLLASPALLAGV